MFVKKNRVGWSNVCQHPTGGVAVGPILYIVYIRTSNTVYRIYHNTKQEGAL